MGLNFCSSRKDFIQSHQYIVSQQFHTKYTFIKTIGWGSYSQVKLAFQNNNQQKVAVKIIQKAQLLKNNLYANVLRQKQILSKIHSQLQSCPFIIKLLECSQDFQSLYFILEYVPNGNMRDLLKNKKTLSIDRIKFVSVCLLLALERLNHLKIIHGDIKPENILIDDEGYVKIIDFSSSKYYGCASKQIKGTKGYIAPEIKNQTISEIKNNKSDIYSLGKIMWEMAYGTKHQNKVKKSKSINQDCQLTGDSSEDSLDTFNTDPLFEDFLSFILKQDPSERPSLQSLWSHAWLNISKSQKTTYLKKNLSPHPLHPLPEFLKYSKTSTHQIPRLSKNFEEQNDSLLSSVLLSQRRNQELFASFSMPINNKKNNSCFGF